jgi:hypothetical protein
VRLPRVRITVRFLMLVVVVVAVILQMSGLRRQVRYYSIRAEEYVLLQQIYADRASSLEFRMARTARPMEEPRYARWIQQLAQYRSKVQYYAERERRCRRAAAHPWERAAIGPREMTLRLDGFELEDP